MWVYSPKPAKLTAGDKTRLAKTVEQFLASPTRLAELVNRSEIRAGRVYLYRLYEQFGWDNPDAQFIKSLIDGKYSEFPLARITLFDKYGNKGKVDWPRHTGEWVELFTGSLQECLEFVDGNDEWFC